MNETRVFNDVGGLCDIQKDKTEDFEKRERERCVCVFASSSSSWPFKILRNKVLNLKKKMWSFKLLYYILRRRRRRRRRRLLVLLLLLLVSFPNQPLDFLDQLFVL